MSYVLKKINQCLGREKDPLLKDIDTSGMDADEIAAARAQALLEKSQYDVEGEHLMAPDKLEDKLREEFAEMGVHGYRMLPDPAGKEKYGISFEHRQILTEDFTKLNMLTPKEQKPEWVKFIEQLTGFFSLLLWGGAILCFIGYILRSDIDNLYLGIVLSAVTLVTGIFSYMQDAKSASLMAQFSKLMAKKIHVETDKAWDGEKERWIQDNHAFDPTRLTRGDIVHLKSGDAVPADLRVLESSDFHVDNSALTGEPDALLRKPGHGKGAVSSDPKEATNMIFFGTGAKQGNCTAVVIRTGDDTMIGKIAQLTESTAALQTPINREIHHFIKIVSGVAIFLGVTFFIIGAALGTDFISNLVFMIGIIVANVPEGLLATVTVCLTLTSKSMASKQVLVKNMEGVETLGSTTCICSDKTGTLTQNKMTFAELIYDMTIKRTEFVEPEKKLDSRGQPLHENLYKDVSFEDPTFVQFHAAMMLNTTASFKTLDVLGSRNGSVKPIPFYAKRHEKGSIPTVRWDTEGDASESSIIKFAQFMYPHVRNDKFRNPDLKFIPGTSPHAPPSVLQIHDRDWVVYARNKFPLAHVGADIPFNSANKYHLKITQNKGNDANPYTVWIKGAPERIIARCNRQVVEGEVVDMSDDDLKKINGLIKELMAKGRRVLAFARYDMTPDELPPEREERTSVKGSDGTITDKVVVKRFICTPPNAVNFPMGGSSSADLSERPEAMSDENWAMAQKKMIFLGASALIDPPRPSVPDAVLSCQRAGIRVVMVTGDHPETAAAIARMVNIFTGPYKKVEDVKADGMDPLANPAVSEARAIVVPGWEINASTTDAMWRYIFAHDEVVFARTSPQQKLQIVQRFQDMDKEIVAVTGDGVNDAPALKKADIGVAMGIAGTEVSKTAADMILLDDNFASIVNGVKEGRLIFDNLKKSIAYTLSSNIPEIAPFLCFITVQTPLPLSTVLILCIDLGTDMVPAISMAWENPESDIMRRPARDSDVDRLVTKKLISFAYLQIGIVQAAAGFFTWMVVLNDYGYAPSTLPGLGSFDNWGKQVLFCRVEGGLWRNNAGDVYAITGSSGAAAIDAGYLFWDPDHTGEIVECTYAAKNFKGGDDGSFSLQDASTYGRFTANFEVMSIESLKSLKDAGFNEYIPWKAHQSPFWENDWLNMRLIDDDAPGMGTDVDDQIRFRFQLPGVYSITDFAGSNPSTSDNAQGSSTALLAAEHALGTEKTFENAVFYQPEISTANQGSWTADQINKFSYGSRDADGNLRFNIASRMCQKEALHHAQCAYFVTIVVVQWADLLICKTRWLSIKHQGLRNPAMNFGLLFETILASVICYTPGLSTAVGTRNLRALHWVPAVPFSIIIFLYDEVRKYIMRATSHDRLQGLQVIKEYGWLARNTYY